MRRVLVYTANKPVGAKHGGAVVAQHGSKHGSARLFQVYGRLIGPLLGGYLLFDKAFAYLHIPGTPLFISEVLLALGVIAALIGTPLFRAPIRDEPVLAMLGAFTLWGLIRAVPGVFVYQLDAVRDSALWYYSLFAFLITAAVASSPELIDRLIGQLIWLTPWLLLWLPLALVLAPFSTHVPAVPFSTISVLSHKPGNAAIAAILSLACIWLFPERRSSRSRAVWSMMALVVIALAATQNRGGLLGVVAGAAVGLAFMRNRWGLVARGVLVAVITLALATMLSLKVPFSGIQGREYSAQQLVANVLSLAGKDSPGNLGGTVEGRQELWTRILAKQVADDRLIGGSGFGQNLAAEVGVYDEGKDTLRSPHNSHLHILARMGVVGLSLWIALWVGWYWRLIGSCRRLARNQQHFTRRVTVLALVVTTAILVSSVFDPQLEGPQVAALLWTTFGLGVAATSNRPWAVRGSVLTAGTGDPALSRRARRAAERLNA